MVKFIPGLESEFFCLSSFSLGKSKFFIVKNLFKLLLLNFVIVVKVL